MFKQLFNKVANAGVNITVDKEAGVVSGALKGGAIGGLGLAALVALYKTGKLRGLDKIKSGLQTDIKGLFNNQSETADKAKWEALMDKYMKAENTQKDIVKFLPGDIAQAGGTGLVLGGLAGSTLGGIGDMFKKDKKENEKEASLLKVAAFMEGYLQKDAYAGDDLVDKDEEKKDKSSVWKKLGIGAAGAAGAGGLGYLLYKYLQSNKKPVMTEDIKAPTPTPKAAYYRANRCFNYLDKKLK